MADPHFFDNAGPFSLKELCHRGGCRLNNDTDCDVVVSDVAPLDSALSDQISFFDNRKYLESFQSTKAGACIVHSKAIGDAPMGTKLLVSENPYKSYALIAQAFYPTPALKPEIHSSVVIGENVDIGDGCEIGPGVVLGDGSAIGTGSRIEANTVIGRNCRIGADARIGSNVSISHAHIGGNARIHNGVRIGQDGFGFAPDPGGHVKIPQLGRVMIGDDVEIGANTTIDRGAGPDTLIGDGCWLDNQVMIGHNVELGRGVIIVAQSGVSGSTKLGDFAVMGAQTGLAGHLNVGAGAQLAARAGVMHDIPAGETWMGAPAQPIKQFFRQLAWLKKQTAQKK